MADMQGTFTVESLVATLLPRASLDSVSMVSQLWAAKAFPTLTGLCLADLLKRNKAVSHSHTCASLDSKS